MFPLKLIFGFDVHTPVSWVPIPGVLYFRNPRDTAAVSEAVRGDWSRAECSSVEIVLLNSVWTIVPECPQQIVDLALRKLVIVADGFGPGVGSKEKQFNANIIKVSAGEGDRIRLQVLHGLINED